jgi:hypothetical protein
MESELKKTFGYEWLEVIRCKIFKKYGTKNPKFVLAGFAKNDNELVEWCNRMLLFKRFIKYKKMTNSLFELKSFFPDPSDEFCKRIIQETFVFDDFFGGLKADDFLYESWYCDTFYSFSQIKREALFVLKTGYSELHILGSRKKSNQPNSNKKILEMMPYEPEIEVMIRDGYLNLEYED